MFCEKIDKVRFLNDSVALCVMLDVLVVQSDNPNVLSHLELQYSIESMGMTLLRLESVFCRIVILSCSPRRAGPRQSEHDRFLLMTMLATARCWLAERALQFFPPSERTPQSELSCTAFYFQSE